MNKAVDNGLGLIFLFQHLQHLAWKGGVVWSWKTPNIVLLMEMVLISARLCLDQTFPNDLCLF